MYMYNNITHTHTHTHTHCDMPTLFLYRRPWTLLPSAVRGDSLGLGSGDGGRWSWIHGGWSSGLPWQKLRSLAHWTERNWGGQHHLIKHKVILRAYYNIAGKSLSFTIFTNNGLSVKNKHDCTMNNGMITCISKVKPVKWKRAPIRKNWIPQKFPAIR